MGMAIIFFRAVLQTPIPILLLEFREKGVGFKSSMNPVSSIFGRRGVQAIDFALQWWRVGNRPLLLGAPPPWRPPRWFPPLVIGICTTIWVRLGSGFGKRFEGFATHDDAMSGRQLFESLEIIGQMPNHLVVLPNSVTFARSGNQGNHGFGFPGRSFFLPVKS